MSSQSLLSQIRHSFPFKKKSTEPHFIDVNADFEVVVLGTKGGLSEGNLSAYLIRPLHSYDAILCDAGTIEHGLRKAEEAGAFHDYPLQHHNTSGARIAQILHHRIKAYLISHAHLDHVAGLVLASPDDTAKPILALPEIRENLSKHLFNNKIWANFGDKGSKPIKAHYQYQDLEVGQKTDIEKTAMSVKAYPLKHGTLTSTAFLIESNDKEILYLGDTEADPEDNGKNERPLANLWKEIAPSIRQGKLKAILIEATYPDSRSDDALYGHMKPSQLLASLRELALICGGRHYIRSLKLIITHVKGDFSQDDATTKQIARDLNDGNDIGIYFLMARQGERYHL